jgi:hypothetical protein
MREMREINKTPNSALSTQHSLMPSINYWYSTNVRG